MTGKPPGNQTGRRGPRGTQRPVGSPGRNPLAELSERGKAYAEDESYVAGLGGGSRARRKDATGRKRDYHKSSQALAVRLPADVAEKIRARAQAEGLTVNAWLAARLMELVEG